MFNSAVVPGEFVTKKPIDERIPRFIKSKFVILNIPESVTEEMLKEKFKKYGPFRKKNTLNYQSKSKTGNKDGGRCFLNVKSDDIGDKVVKDFG